MSSLSSKKSLKSFSGPAWFSSGSVYEVSRSSSSSSKNDKVLVNLQGESFCDLVKNTPYGGTVNINLDYEVRLVHKQLHWLLLLKAKESDISISMEITTSTMTDLVEMVSIFEGDSIPNSTSIATLKMKLSDIAEHADNVVKTMGTYNLFSRNCQHFCNTLLKRLGLRTFPTTVGPDTADGFDSFTARILIGIALGKTFVVPKGVDSVVAGMVNTSLVRRS